MSPRTLLTRLLPALALAAGAAVVALPAAAADHRPVVRFQDYPGHGNLLIRVARSKGWCEAAGITCELKPIPQAPLGIQALIGGSIDVAQTPIEVLASAVLRGARLHAVVGSAVTNIFQIDAAAGLALAHEAQGFPAVMQDFKGKKIGVTARGSASESFFAWLMQQADQQTDDVTYVAVGAPNTAFAALRQGQVDAIVSFEPAGTMCEMSRACRVVYRGATADQPALLRSMYGAGVALVMRAEQIAAQPNVAQAVVKISRQAADFVNHRANEAEVLKISAQYFPYDMPQGDAIARHALKLGIDSGTYKTMVRRSAVQSTLTYMQQTRQLPGTPTVEDLVWDGAPQE
ncbi:MAG: ABC transporter substrate-binding protein [Comamonas sp.]|nr:ABC transporter substrate-binding protein [Comamonas sp.]